MQLDDVAPSIAPLPAPGLFERLVLESPFALALSLALIGLGGLVALNARGRLRTGLVVLGAAWALGGAAVLASVLVETPRERLIRRTRELVAALARVDTDAMRALIHEDASVEVERLSRFSGRDSIIDAASRYLGSTYRLESHATPEVQAVIDGPNAARTQARVRHTGEGIPPASWWRISWYRPSEREPWVAVEIEPLWIAWVGNF